MNILIVEDNPKMRRMLADFVEHKFERIYECADGDEAFALYERHQPDWVLIDWQMPNKDGIAATREIIAEYPKANICMITNFDDAVLEEEAAKAGARQFLLKKNLFKLEMILV